MQWRGLIFVYLILLGSCVRPGDNAINDPSKDTAVIISGKPGNKVYIIEIDNMKFQPDKITLHKGDTVMWKNNDLVAHCVTEETSKAWTSSKIPAGASWKMVVNSGANYFCAIHMVMKGKIIVEGD